MHIFMQKMSENVFFQLSPYGNNTYKHVWHDINFVVEINLLALNVLTEMNSIAYTFQLCSVIDKFM